MTTGILNESQQRTFRSTLASFPPSVFSVLALLILAMFWLPHILQPTFLLLIARQSAALGIVVLGQMIVIRGGTIDLSSAGVFLLANYVLTSGLIPSDAPALQIAAPIILGIVIGVINGVLIAKVKVSSLIVTLAMSTIMTGVVLLFSTGRLPGSMPELVRLIGYQRLGIVPINTIIWVFFVAVVGIALHNTAYGRLLSAVGDNAVAAITSGLPVDRIIFLNHVLAGFFSGLGALIFAGFIGMGSYTEGTGVALNSLAATILGGVSWGSGKGGVIGPFLGVWTIMLLFNMIVNLKMGAPGQLIVQSLVIFVAALIQRFRTS